MPTTHQRKTTRANRRMLEAIHKGMSMEPRAFKGRWGITSEQLADLMGVSKYTADCWLIDPSKGSHRPCSPPQKDRLAEINFIWEHISQAPAHLIEKYSAYLQK